MPWTPAEHHLFPSPCRDCIELVKERLIEAGWATKEELKEKEKELRAQVQKEVDEAKQG